MLLSMESFHQPFQREGEGKCEPVKEGKERKREVIEKSLKELKRIKHNLALSIVTVLA